MGLAVYKLVGLLAQGAGLPAPPNNLVAPVVTGTGVVGQTLSCTTGTWSGSPTPTYEYQWLRDGGSISGATDATYELVEDDIDAMISCEVTATNSEGNDSAESNAVGPIQDIGEAGSLDFSINTNSQYVPLIF